MNIGFFELSGIEDFSIRVEQFSVVFKELNTDIDFFYFNGLVNFQLKYFSIAGKNLEHYVVSVGHEGKHYVEALKIITLLEDQQPVENAPQNDITKPLSVISGEQRGGYIKSLQALYLTDDPVKALEMQINSLLSVHTYTGSRVKKSDVRSGLIYSLSVVDNHLNLQEKKYALLPIVKKKFQS